MRAGGRRLLSTGASRVGAAHAVAPAPAQPHRLWTRLPPRLASPGASRVLELAWPERGRIGAGVALSIVASGLSLAFPAAIGWMVDLTLASSRVADAAAAAAPAAPHSLASAGVAFGPYAASGALLAIFVAQAAVMVLRARLLTTAGENIAASMRVRAFASLLRQEVSFFDRHESGELLNRLSADCAQLQKVVGYTAAQALRSLTMAAGSTAMLLAISPSLAGLILAVFPAVFAAGALQGRAMRKEQKAVQALLARAGALAARSLTSLRTLRALGVERAQLPQYAAAVDGARAQAVAVGVRSAAFDSGVFFAANLAMLAVVSRGSALVSSGELSAGELSSVVLYSMWLGFASSSLAQSYAEAMRAAGASERLLQLMSRTPQMNDSGGLRLPLPPDGLGAGGAAGGARGLSVEFRDVHFAYAARAPGDGAGGDDGDVDADAEGALEQPDAAGANGRGSPRAASISGLSLRIRPGERVGLIGRSGCGKSTLLRLLSRLYDVDSGAVLVGGVDVRALDPAQLRGRVVGVVPQEPALLSGSIGDNVALGAGLRGDFELGADGWLPGAAEDGAPAADPAEDARMRAAVDAAVDAAGLRALVRSLPEGLGTQVGEGGITLSGGEKQRVAIARLLLAAPQVVLLDEFSSALDQATEAKVSERLAELLAGRTVLTVAHRLAALRALRVERIIELGAGGEIVADLSMAEWEARGGTLEHMRGVRAGVAAGVGFG